MAQIIHQPENQRFVQIEADGTAEVTYTLSANVVTITHTFVPADWRGRGVASDLLKAILGWVDSQDHKVASQCSYATTFLARHAEFHHLRASDSPRSQ